ncbi:hypothetical protein [Methanolapillus ohkumae]|uniref:DUF4367 domain-containing protein n=1 Tax=Methanolapillus ohkumae TaxID=3028298 RepID=A0AA96VEB0_9EURY|nr:hypothetical protein MsAm2_04890 [Methanosarcinaceae archaeon Am2]
MTIMSKKSISCIIFLIFIASLFFSPALAAPASSQVGKYVYVYNVSAIPKNPGLLSLEAPAKMRTVTPEMVNISKLPPGFSLMAIRPVDADEYFKNKTLPGFQGTYQHSGGGNAYLTIYQFETTGNAGADELRKAFVDRYKSEDGISTVEINGKYVTKISKYILAPGNFRYMYFWPEDNLLVIVDGNIADDMLMKSFANAVNLNAHTNNTSPTANNTVTNSTAA